MHSDFYLSLHKANLSYIILNTILKNFEITSDFPNGVAYLKSSIGYMIYGWIIEWINSGMQESGSKLEKLFNSTNKI